MDQVQAEQSVDDKPKKKRATAEDKRQELLAQFRQRAQERGESKLSREQRLALHIANLPEKSEKDLAMLRTILDAERAAIIARRKKADAARVYQNVAEKERRARTRRLIELGGLVDIAGVSNYDKSVLLGALASIPELPENQVESLRQRGMKVFDDREAAKEAEKAEQEAAKAQKSAEAEKEQPKHDRYGNPIST